MKTWFCVSKYGRDIRPVKVVRENEKTVVVAVKQFRLSGDAPDEWIEQRRNKVSEHECYFPTIGEACQFLRESVENEVKQAEAALARAIARQESVNSFIAELEARMAITQ